MRGKQWTNAEEQKLIHLTKEHTSLSVIASALKKTEDAVSIKMKRLGLVVVVARKHTPTTTTSIKLPDELPTIEDVMKILNKALEDLKEPGLDQTEVIRLRSLVHAVKIYNELFSDYVHYREIEAELVELRRGYEGLVKKKNDDSKAAE